ncbi:trehalose-6-phosphate synthase [Streptacidiphilus sp. ASG 303]|uniref:alpha,alpha-trehalose-phosphate synthase (UDP-forming) n=1 Tax=Streptacidiphilus sp. ASG 303 TaxID=2896847 RepID=UPI001E3AC15E|nr:trehalose-6-phosphate synthase [Streptacidiphilus sp. ASG 303]MCD0485717.1 trehalose-6-phosphate synthase [Streptacidiphilus sp. ASG 303]
MAETAARPDLPAPARGGAPVLVASNRGPVSFTVGDDGGLSLKRGGGGLVSGLSAIGDTDAVWVCAALTEGDRTAARQAPSGRLDRAGHDTGGQSVRMLDIDPGTFARAYNGIANSTLWFVHHLLYNTPVAPDFDERFRKEWASYETYNAAFADALAEEAAEGAAVLVQDYHLTLVPGLLRERRPDLRIGHFSHTPWAPPDYYRMLPDDVAREVLAGILGADRAAFLTRRWADAFADCCEDVLGARVERPADGGDLRIVHGGRTTRIGVHGLGADADFLRERAHRPDVDSRLATLREAVGDRRVVVRVDRTELSKNIVRGLLAYRHLLRTRPEWHDRVVHVAFAYPSRHDLPEYREYTAAVQRIAREVNDEFGTEGWQPLILHVEDDFPRSLAAYRLADVALVNPIRDGMNLVAKEIPVVSDQGCALVLSREAGAHAELGEDAVTVNPYDVVATAEALHRALSMPASERTDRSKRLAAAATALPPQQWFLDQLAALSS